MEVLRMRARGGMVHAVSFGSSPVDVFTPSRARSGARVGRLIPSAAAARDTFPSAVSLVCHTRSRVLLSQEALSGDASSSDAAGSFRSRFPGGTYGPSAMTTARLI